MELAASAAGLAGLAGLTLQLAQVARDCANIYSGVKEAGYTHDSILHSLRTEGLRLKRWEQAWGLDTGNTSGKQLQLLDPNDERYRYAAAGLARIVYVFTKIAELQSKYQIEPETNKRIRDRLGVGKLFPRSRSKSPNPANASRVTQPSMPTLSHSDLCLLENPKTLTSTQLLPGLQEEIASLSSIAQKVQQSLSIYRKLRWAGMDKANCNELVGQLKEYIDGLFSVLPPDSTPVSVPQSQTVPKTRLSLSFNIPFNISNVRRNPDFVERECLLEQLAHEIDEGRAAMNITQIVLHGMGGMGKTQIALEYVYRHHKDYSSVFWINASSEQTTKTSFIQIMEQLIEYHATLLDEPDYKHIGSLLGMAGKLDSVGLFSTEKPEEEQHVIKAVKKWLTAKQNDKWLLVFDNLDDLESFDINDYIPSCDFGTVIITSRRRGSTQGRRGLEVHQMQNHEAEKLLLTSARLDLGRLAPEECKLEEAAAVTIVEKLGYLPLAIAQAGAYINIQQCLFSHYLREYEINANRLLSRRWKVEKDDRSVFATWEMSFNAIKNQNPKAAELLSLCAFLDNNDICEEFLRRGMKLAINDTSLADSIHLLFSYSIAKRTEKYDSFNIHPLVHLCIRWKLEMEPNEYQKMAIKAFLMVTSGIAVPEDREREVSDWIFERRNLPHVFAVERQMEFLPLEKEESLAALENLCSFYANHGHYGKAEEMCKVILATREKLGADHPSTLHTVHNIAVVYEQQGKYSQALELYQRALAGYEKSLGVDHPSTLRTVNNMAVVYENQGKYSQALELYQRALAGREKSLGVDHPSTLNTVNNMAVVYEQQGKYSQALELYQRALAGCEKSLGVDHPSTLNTVNNMAVVYEQQGKYSQALEMYQRALAGYEKSLGIVHPSTLNTVNNMAVVYEQQGKYSQALELYQRALAGSEKSLGVDHPSTLDTVYNMAGVYVQQGKYSQALELYQRALAGCEKSLGVDHPSTLRTVNNMAVVYENQGKYSQALELYQRALAGREKSLGVDHPSTLDTVYNMAGVYVQQGKYSQALELYQRALAGCEKSLGVDHPSTLRTVHNMAVLYENQEKYSQALELYQRALAGMEKALGTDHPYTVSSMKGVERCRAALK
ncbi:hypothetical protein BDZ91DRAFT_762700 [Kalaharituber pfeilii]|nr:hypothetical protein BDZ91DRAFT_762700 [Kalaharituber pfeilii]